MGLIVCEQSEVLHPLYITELNIHVYSLEELLYVIYENPILARESLISQPLFEFLDLELGLLQLSSYLQKMKKEQASNDEILLTLLDCTRMYSAVELNHYRKKLEAYRKLHRAEYLFEMANTLFEQKRYQRAADTYQKVLNFPKDTVVTDEFLASVHANLGSAYANLFLFLDAYKEYAIAYNQIKDRHCLKEMYHIMLIAPDFSFDEQYFQDLDEQSKKEWDAEFRDSLEQATSLPILKEISQWFSHDHTDDTDKKVESIIQTWKQEYRNMM